MDLSVHGTEPPQLSRAPSTASPSAAPQANPMPSERMVTATSESQTRRQSDIQVGAETRAQETTAAGMLDGATFASTERTGGKFGVGLGLGVPTGLIGTGVGYFVIGPEPITAEALQHAASKTTDYQMGFKAGWEQTTQSNKRHAFLVGGLPGTAAYSSCLLSQRSRGPMVTDDRDVRSLLLS